MIHTGKSNMEKDSKPLQRKVMSVAFSQPGDSINHPAQINRKKL